MIDWFRNLNLPSRKNLFVWLLVFLTTGNVFADAPPTGQPYVVQTGDTLEKLAEKYYQDSEAWPAIMLATNQAAADSQYNRITHPAQVQLGYQLWIPEPEQVEILLAEYRARPKPQPLTSERLAEFETFIEEFRIQQEIPGTAVVLIQGDEIIYSRGFGVRELGKSEPVTPETIFAVGSTTKSMNALMIATMVDEGKVRWNQHVTQLWPDFTLSDMAQTPKIRLRDLLNMGSGISRQDLLWSGVPLTAEALMESVAELPVQGDVGEYYFYNNQMVATAGYIAALEAGGEYGHLLESYIQQLQSRVFDPIGMSSATCSVEMALAQPNHATPHDINLFGEIVPTHYHVDESITPAGGVYANALDMAKFLIVQMNGGVTQEGKQIVSLTNLREMHRPQTKITPELSYGMGWFIEEYEGVQMVWHDGDVFGFKSLLLFFPEADLGMVLLSNRMLSYGFQSGVQYRLVEIVFDLPPEVEELYNNWWEYFHDNLLNLQAEVASQTVDPAIVSEYVGSYSDHWQIELRENKLYAVRGSYEWHLLPAKGDYYIISNGYGIGTTFYLKKDEETGKITMRFKLVSGEEGVYELQPDEAE